MEVNSQEDVKNALKLASEGVITQKEMSYGPLIKIENDQKSAFQIVFFLNYLKALQEKNLISSEQLERFIENLNMLIFKFWDILRNDSIIGLSYGKEIGKPLEELFEINTNPQITIDLLRSSRIAVIKKGTLEIENGALINQINFGERKMGGGYKFIFTAGSFSSIGFNGKNYIDINNPKHVWGVINDFDGYIQALLKDYYFNEIVKIGDFSISCSLLSILIILRLTECISDGSFQPLQIP